MGNYWVRSPGGNTREEDEELEDREGDSEAEDEWVARRVNWDGESETSEGTEGSDRDMEETEEEQANQHVFLERGGPRIWEDQRNYDLMVVVASEGDIPQALLIKRLKAKLAENGMDNFNGVVHVYFRHLQGVNIAKLYAQIRWAFKSVDLDRKYFLHFVFMFEGREGEVLTRAQIEQLARCIAQFPFNEEGEQVYNFPLMILQHTTLSFRSRRVIDGVENILLLTDHVQRFWSSFKGRGGGRVEREEDEDESSGNPRAPLSELHLPGDIQDEELHAFTSLVEVTRVRGLDFVELPLNFTAEAPLLYKYVKMNQIRYCTDVIEGIDFDYNVRDHVLELTQFLIQEPTLVGQVALLVNLNKPGEFKTWCELMANFNSFRDNPRLDNNKSRDKTRLVIHLPSGVAGYERRVEKEYLDSFSRLLAAYGENGPMLVRLHFPYPTINELRADEMRDLRSAFPGKSSWRIMIHVIIPKTMEEWKEKDANGNLQGEIEKFIRHAQPLHFLFLQAWYFMFFQPTHHEAEVRDEMKKSIPKNIRIALSECVEQPWPRLLLS